jgi:predicted dehydrogenase
MEIGVNKEFFDWLTDPVQNGGGALVDFGCYGANLMTYLMKGEKPISVTAVTRQFKPSIYPKVDDEATIIVSYPSAQCIIQASWNWPFGRKDMEVYGENGYIIAANNTSMRVRNRKTDGEQSRLVTTREMPVYQDPFSYFADVIRGKIEIPKNGLYSLENNFTVVQILDAARRSAATGKTVFLKPVQTSENKN